MHSFTRTRRLLLAALFGLAAQMPTHALEVKGEGIDCSVNINQGSQFTKLSLFPLIKLEQYGSGASGPGIVHMEILELPFIESINVGKKRRENTQGCCQLLPAENEAASFKTHRGDVPLFSLVDAVIVDNEQFVQAKFIDSPVFTLLSETRHGINLENRQWEAFDLPLITTLAVKTTPDSSHRQFLNTPVADVYESKTWGETSEMAILDVPLISLYESAAKDGKTRRSLLTSSWTMIDAPLFGIWSSEDTDSDWKDHRFLTLPLIGSLWSTETDRTEQVGRIFRIPVYRKN